MINKIVAIQGNHPSKLNPKTDTSVFLANEIQKKNYRIFYYDPKNLSIINSKVIAEGFFIKFNYNNKKFYKILKKQKLNLIKCKYVLIRQDPPFNLEYISSTFILETLRNKVKIINNPTAIRNISEKFIQLNIKDLCQIQFLHKISRRLKIFKKNKHVILKPIHSFSGNNLHLLNKFKLKFIQKLIKKHNYIMCQNTYPK